MVMGFLQSALLAAVRMRSWSSFGDFGGGDDRCGRFCVRASEM